MFPFHFITIYFDCEMQNKTFFLPKLTQQKKRQKTKILNLLFSALVILFTLIQQFMDMLLICVNIQIQNRHALIINRSVGSVHRNYRLLRL